MTSILLRVGEYFPNEYNKIAILKIDLSKKYQQETHKNDAPDNVINSLTSFDPGSIHKLLSGITNISDKALISIYTLSPPRRIMDYQLIKITYETDIEKLKLGFNYIILKMKHRLYLYS